MNLTRKTETYSIDTKSKGNTGGSSVVVDLLFNVFSIVCGGSVSVFVLLCITLGPL